MEVIWLYYLVLTKTKFMSGYLYFPKNLKDIKHHMLYIGSYDNLQNVFPINGI